MEKGPTANPTTTRSADKDFLSLMTGRLSGMQAYMTGRLKVSGDVMKSRLLAKMFRFQVRREYAFFKAKNKIKERKQR